MDKIYIGIDASSSAIGLSMVKNGQLKQHKVFYPEDRGAESTARVISLKEQMETAFEKISKWEPDTEKIVILNRGYVPSNLINPLKAVEYAIWFCAMKYDMGWLDVLDSSWHHHIGLTGKVKRSDKKMATVQYVVKNYLDGHTVSHTNKEMYNYFKTCPPGMVCTTGSYSISDDEADAIIVVFMYLDGKISGNATATRKEKNKWEKNRKIQSEIAKHDRRIKTILDHIIKNRKEIEQATDELKDNPESIRTQNKITTRESNIKLLENERAELEIKCEKLKQGIA